MHSEPIRPPTPSRLAFLLVLCLLPLGCEDSPVQFVDRKPLAPLTVYWTWWQEVAGCMERQDLATHERFGRIEWFVAEEIHDDRLGPHQMIWGNWIAPHEITIRSDALLDRITVTHEMVHDVLQTRGHDSPAFDECVTPCLYGSCGT